MKTIFLTIVAVLVVLFPLVPLLQFNLGHQVMTDGFTVSSSTVWLISIVFSTFSWFLFAWASKSIKVEGILLSIISGAVLIIPFHDVLGPMASVIIGLVAGFAAFMFQKYMTTRDNKSLIIPIATVAVSYLALTMLLVLVSNTTHPWDTGDGIGEWTGTAEKMEPTRIGIGQSFIFKYVSVETFEKITEPEQKIIPEIDCRYENQYVFDRPNGKLACVEFSTGEKLGWRVVPDY